MKLVMAPRQRGENTWLLGPEKPGGGAPSRRASCLQLSHFPRGRSSFLLELVQFGFLQGAKHIPTETGESVRNSIRLGKKSEAQTKPNEPKTPKMCISSVHGKITSYMSLCVYT